MKSGRQKIKYQIIGLILTFGLLFGCAGGVTVHASAEPAGSGSVLLRENNAPLTDDKIEAALEKILIFYAGGTDSASLQKWLNETLSPNLQSANLWCTLALFRYSEMLEEDEKPDFSGIGDNLAGFVEGGQIGSATTRELYALALVALGYSDHLFVEKTVREDIGSLGVMSYVYGLQLLRNTGDFGGFTAASIIEELAGLEKANGGFALRGDTADPDVTAMAIQALAPFKSNETAAALVRRGLSALHTLQLPSGGFKSYGADNPESCAQVLMAALAAGDSALLESGLISHLLSFQLPDGSFTHDGKTANTAATYQAFVALTAWKLSQKGLSDFYDVSGLNPDEYSEDDISGDASEDDITGDASEGDVSGDAPGGDNSGDRPGGDHPEEPTVDAENPTEGQNEPGGNGEEDRPGTGLQGEDEPQGGDEPENVDYRTLVTIGILAAALILSIILILCKKRSPKNFIAIAMVAGALILATWLIRIETPEEYYKAVPTVENPVGTVTFSIRCDVLKGISDGSEMGADGSEMGADVSEITVDIAEGDTVYDLLMRVSKAYGIPVVHAGAEADKSIYISGIGGLYEFDYGDLSGWVYLVNGARPSVGVDHYAVQNGDRVEFAYTLNLGKDLEAE